MNFNYTHHMVLQKINTVECINAAKKRNLQ